MYYFIQVQKDSPNLTVDDNFDHSIIKLPPGSDYMKVLCSNVIRKELDEFNRKNIFSPASFSVYEDNFYYSFAICDGDYFSYSFICYLFFVNPSEVIEFSNSFTSDPDLQFKLRLVLQDVIDKFSFDPSFKISAIEVLDLIEDLVSVNHNFEK